MRPRLPRWDILLWTALVAAVFGLVLSERIRASSGWEVLGRDRLSQPNVKRLKVDGPLVYIGTAFKLNVYDTRTGKVTVVEGLPDTYITAIEADENFLWVGTMSGGLAQVDKRTLKVLRVFTKEQNTAGRLPDNWITDILSDGSVLWIATKRWGVVRYDPVANVWSAKPYTILEGLADNAVNGLALDGSSIWAATDGGVSVYDTSFDLWMSYGPKEGLPSERATCVAVDGGAVWVGTPAGVARYDKLEGRFTVFDTRRGLVDNSVQRVTVDGLYVWVGTFAGVSRLDKATGVWTTLEGLPEESVSDMAVDGNFLWFGTEGGGAARYDKKVPQASISPRTRYRTNEAVVEIVGTAHSYKEIASFDLEYRSEILDQYLKAGITPERPGRIVEGRLGLWDVSKVNNIPHYLRLTVRDRDGAINRSEMAFIVDTIDPVLQVDALPEAVGKADITVTGRYNELNLVRITVRRGNTVWPAEVDRKNRTFAWYASLVPGPNTLDITAEDIAGRRTTVRQTVVYDPDDDRPRLEVTARTTSSAATFVVRGRCRDYSLKSVVVQPGNHNASFEPVSGEAFTYAFATAGLPLKEGENRFTVEAYDRLGRKAQAVVTVLYAGGAPSVTLEKPTARTNRRTILVQGSWADDNPKEIVVEPGGVRASLNLQARTFSAAITLKEGPNLVTATIYDRDGQMAVDSWEVVYSASDAKIVLDLPSSHVATRRLPITGTFREPAARRVVLQPGDLPLSMGSNTFEGVVNLGREVNDFRVELLDRTGRVLAGLPFRVVLDETPPVLVFPTVPAVVGESPAVLKGLYRETSLRRIVAEPSGVEAEVDTNARSFVLKVPVQPGRNAVTVRASDLAGNETMREVVVVYRPGAVTEEVALDGAGSDPSLMARLRELEERLARLQGRPAATAVPQRPVRPRMPEGLAVFFVPYDPVSDRSLQDLTREYLGSLAWWPVVSAINDVPDRSVLVSRRKVLFPSQAMVRYLHGAGLSSAAGRLMGAAALAFNIAGDGRSPAEYRRRTEEILVRERILKGPSSGEALVVDGVMLVFGRAAAGMPKARPDVRMVIQALPEGPTLRFRVL